MPCRWAIPAAAALTALAISTTSASAASTRPEYVAQAEPICQATQNPLFKAYAALFKSAAKHHGSGPLLKFYARIGNIYGTETTQLGAVAPAPGDESTVSAWLDARTQTKVLFDQSRRALKNGKPKRSKRLMKSTFAEDKQATRIASGLGFQYCALGIGEARSDAPPF